MADISEILSNQEINIDKEKLQEACNVLSEIVQKFNP
jgi:hypothetical protein